MNYWTDDEKNRINELFTKATANIQQELDKVNDIICESTFYPTRADWEFARVNICKVMIKGFENENNLSQIKITGSVRSGGLYITTRCSAFEKAHTYKMGLQGEFNLKLLVNIHTATGTYSCQ